MKVLKGGTRVLLYEGAGFGLILFLSAFNNLLDLPYLLVGGEGAVSRWRCGALESVMILLIWAFVFSITRRLLRQLRELKGLLRVCAWCRRIRYGEKWMSLEDYFAEGLHIGTTHGICPDCRQKVEDDTKEFRRRQAGAGLKPSRDEGIAPGSPLAA